MFILSSITPYAFDKRTPNFAQGLDFSRCEARFGDSRHSQVSIYAVFDEEPEFEVNKCRTDVRNNATLNI